MRLIIVLLTATILQVSASSYGQSITLKRDRASLVNVFTEIRKQTGYDFFYSDKMMANAKPISIDLKQASLEEALKQIFENQALQYELKDKTVIIQPKEPTFLERLADRWAAIDVTGKVVDEKGQPLPGATVKVKDGKAVITDGQGRFLIENVSEGAVIVISYTGYVSQELVAKQNLGSITLKLSENPLDQVQIIAYGTTSRRLSVSNAVTVTAKEIEQQPVNNPLLALQGRVPGLTITPASGVPGAGITVRIQGRNNLDNTLVGSDPLIVIDGVPYASQNLNTFKGGGDAPILGSSSNDGLASVNNYGNPLSYINPSDIESITILKDAEGTAIYGSRAANGAILITTKKGKVGDFRTDFNLQQGAGQIGKKIDLLNSQQYMEMRREAFRNDARAINSTAWDMRGVWDTTRYTDWQKELIGGTASFTRLTAGVSGGSTTIQYLISSTYGRETSVFPGDVANIFGSVHFNLSSASINQRFKIQLGGTYMVNSNKLPAQDYVNQALNLPPVAPPLYNADGTLNWAPDPNTGNSTWFNPLSRQYNLFETKTNNFISNGSLSYQIIPGFELKSTFGFTSNTSDQFIAGLDENEKPERRANRSRSAIFSFNTSRSWIAEPQLIFQQNWSNHALIVLAGATFQHQSNNGRAFTTVGQSSDLLLRDMLGGTSVSANGVDINDYKYNAVFSRLNYSFKNKYLVNLTIRRDGSSRFGPNRQFNNFGAIGAGWILSEERLFKQSLSFISFAKLRGSYGTTGNDQIGNYRFMNLFYPAYQGIPYQGQGTLVPLGLSNPNLEWEETRKLQMGLDIGLLKDRLLFTINYVGNRSSNSLTSVKIPIVSGFNVLVTNLPALIQNTAWEFSLNTLNINKGDFRWNSSLNLTIPRNKLLAFPGLQNSSLKGLMVIGQPLTIQRTSPFAGVDPLTGLFRSFNRFGEPTSNIEEADQTVFLNNSQRWYGGIQNSITYKGFSLDFFIEAKKQYGDDIFEFGVSPGYFSSSNSTLTYGNQPASVMKRWQKPGDISVYQRFTTGGLSQGAGDRTYRDISFLRVKNVSFSYTVPTKLMRNLKMEQLRLYINGQNLYTLTKYRGLDPETQGVGSLPPLRMMTIGVQGTF